MNKVHAQPWYPSCAYVPACSLSGWKPSVFTGLHASQHILSMRQPQLSNTDAGQPQTTAVQLGTREAEAHSRIQLFRGATGYITAIRKARCREQEVPLDTSDPQTASFLANDTAATFLDKLRHHSSRSAWELSQRQRIGSHQTMVQQRSWWHVGKAEVPAPSPARPWFVLAGPAFVPECFAATGEPEECAALEELKNPRKPFGPDVCHLPRPSDKLAFQYQAQGARRSLTPCRRRLMYLGAGNTQEGFHMQEGCMQDQKNSHRFASRLQTCLMPRCWLTCLPKLCTTAKR